MKKESLINQISGKKTIYSKLRDFEVIIDNSYLTSFLNILDLYKNHKKITLVNKFIDFYNGVNMSQNDWKKFNDRLINSNSLKCEIGEFILDNIDKLNYDKNLNIFICLVRSVATDKLSPDDFFRLIIILQRTPYLDLEALNQYDVDEGIYLGTNTEILLSSGLIYNSVIGTSMLYKINNLGKALLKHGF